MHPFNSSTQEAEAGRSLKFKASLVYRASSRTSSKATEKRCLEKPKKKKRRKERKKERKEERREKKTKFDYQMEK